MTDTNPWPEWIEKVTHPHNDEVFNGYVKLPMNGYQIGNLLGLLESAGPDADTGDWFNEVRSVLYVAAIKAGFNELSSNSGDHWAFALQPRGDSWLVRHTRPDKSVNTFPVWF